MSTFLKQMNFSIFLQGTETPRFLAKNVFRIREIKQSMKFSVALSRTRNFIFPSSASPKMIGPDQSALLDIFQAPYGKICAQTNSSFLEGKSRRGFGRRYVASSSPSLRGTLERFNGERRQK